MKYNIEKEEKYAVLKLQEENLNFSIAPKLKSEFIFLRNEGVPNLIFDMSDLKYVDSSGLSAILTANRLWKDSGSFVMAGELNETITKIIEISRLDGILTMVPTVQEAVDMVFLDEIERNLQAEMEEE